MAKEYWDQWEYRLWKADTRVTKCDPNARGVWFDWLNTMMEDRSYSVSGTLEELAVAARTNVKNVIAAIKVLHLHDVGRFEFEGVPEKSVTHFVTHLSRTFNKKITVVSRKRERERKVKEQNALRQQRFRNKRKSNAEVTPYNKNNIVTKVTKKRLTPKTASFSEPSDHSKLMRHHADRIGVITDGAAQGKHVKDLLARFTIEDCIACYDFQVRELITEGGWRSAVSWRTVSPYIAEWIKAGRPSKPLQKGEKIPGTEAWQSIGKGTLDDIAVSCRTCFDAGEITIFPNEGSIEGAYSAPCPDCKKTSLSCPQIVDNSRAVA